MSALGAVAVGIGLEVLESIPASAKPMIPLEPIYIWL